MEAARQEDHEQPRRRIDPQRVPVKPVWPNEPIGNSSPRLAEIAACRCPSRARARPPSPAASPARSSAPPSAAPARARRRARRRRAACGEARQVARGAEQPGVPGDTAHPPRGRIVHDAAQRRRARRVARPRVHRRRSARSAQSAAAAPRRQEPGVASCRAARRHLACRTDRAACRSRVRPLRRAGRS